MSSTENQLHKQFYTVKEFSQVTGLSKVTIYRRIESGDLPVTRTLGRCLIPAGFLDKMAASALSE